MAYTINKQAREEKAQNTQRLVMKNTDMNKKIYKYTEVKLQNIPASKHGFSLSCNFIYVRNNCWGENQKKKLKKKKERKGKKIKQANDHHLICTAVWNSVSL